MAVRTLGFRLSDPSFTASLWIAIRILRSASGFQKTITPSPMPYAIYTIGHSTRELADFSCVLQAHQIRVLVDIRAFPASRRYPHFNRENLELWLPQIGCEYVWEKDLGGRRKQQMPRNLSPNPALRNESFRNYADYMLSPPFEAAILRVEQLASRANTAIMCAEMVYFRCHRMLVSDYLLSRGHSVLHIHDEKPPRQHSLSKDARIVDGRLVYRGDLLL
jgi:uncharacterized protein (DUF488 family)